MILFSQQFISSVFCVVVPLFYCVHNVITLYKIVRHGVTPWLPRDERGGSADEKVVVEIIGSPEAVAKPTVPKRRVSVMRRGMNLAK